MTKYPVKVDRKMASVVPTVFLVLVFGGIAVSSIGIVFDIPALCLMGIGVCPCPILLCACRMFGVAKTLCCAMGWHCPNSKMLGVHHKTNDPLQFLTFATCSWCGYEGQFDSQGNLF